jgi:hypothetical protein
LIDDPLPVEIVDLDDVSQRRQGVETTLIGSFPGEDHRSIGGIRKDSCLRIDVETAGKYHKQGDLSHPRDGPVSAHFFIHAHRTDTLGPNCLGPHEHNIRDCTHGEEQGAIIFVIEGRGPTPYGRRAIDRLDHVEHHPWTILSLSLLGEEHVEQIDWLTNGFEGSKHAVTLTGNRGMYPERQNSIPLSRSQNRVTTKRPIHFPQQSNDTFTQKRA